MSIIEWPIFDSAILEDNFWIFNGVYYEVYFFEISIHFKHIYIYQNNLLRYNTDMKSVKAGLFVQGQFTHEQFAKKTNQTYTNLT